MPIAIVQDWVEEETDRSTANYDTINERLGAADDPPKGCLMHSAGFTGTGFRIFEVWETQADFDTFLRDRLMPIVQDVSGGDAPMPQMTIYELHNYMTV
jgi:hypothetical protein